VGFEGKNEGKRGKRMKFFTFSLYNNSL
jgi:hypothetical protein